MKFINKFKSPNHNKRKTSKIEFIIIHYTAISNLFDAINYLCDIKKKVSTHFVISQEGDIFRLVNEDQRAWHAGHSFWKNYTDINSMSIGIELDFNPNGKNNKYSLKLIKSLIYLLNYLKKKYKIKNNCILGHSDISPFRKIDPGNKFPWNKLVSKNLSFLPKKQNIKRKKILEKYFSEKNINSKKKQVLFMLAEIGYDTNILKNRKNKFKNLIQSYQLHFYQRNSNGILDQKTFNKIKEHYLNLY